MADFAIGQAFHKSSRSILRVVALTAPRRYFATRDSAGFVTLPTLDTGNSYVEFQGVKQASFQVDNNEQEFRLIGDDGWSDSITTGSRVRSSMSTFFVKNIELPNATVVPEFRGDYSEDFALIEKARYDQDYEVYFELLKEMGRANGGTGNYIYDFAGFNGVVRNYKEAGNPEGLTEVSFDVMSRGRGVFGRYDAGSTPIPIGAIQSTILTTAPSSGTRRYAVVPADNAQAIVVSADLTVTYTSDGTIALTQLSLGQTDGSGFRVETAGGVIVPAVVSLASNIVTINPTANLAAGTIYRLIVRDGAIVQSVDANGTASPTGVRRPLQGFQTSFRTA